VAAAAAAAAAARLHLYTSTLENKKGTAEEKAIARFQRVRQAQVKMSGRLNLEDVGLRKSRS